MLGNCLKNNEAKCKLRELGFRRESSHSKGERESRGGVWNSTGFGFSYHCLGLSLCCVGFFYLFFFFLILRTQDCKFSY